MTAEPGRPKISQRVYYAGEPDWTGTVLTPGDEQSLIAWDNGNETCALNRLLTFLPDEPVKYRGPLARAMREAEKAQATSPTGRLPSQPNMQHIVPKTAEGTAVLEALREACSPKVRKPPPDDLPERLKDYDAAALKQFAVNNGVWQDKYADLPNPGLVRMNVVNRLRAKVKYGHEVVWK